MSSDREGWEPMARTAESVALAAGELLIEHPAYGRRAEVETKDFRRELVTAADRAAEAGIVDRLRAEFPRHGFLAEEGARTKKGCIDPPGAEHVWIIDPLDGTTNYVHGVPTWSVSIGLFVAGVPVVGVVHAPALREMFVAWCGGGAFRNGQPMTTRATPELADSLLATGFAYDRDEAGAVDNLARLRKVMPLCRDIRRLGSAALDLAYVAAGVFDGYWETGLSPYDVAAGAALVREAGGLVTDDEGGEDWLFGRSVVAGADAVHGALIAVLAEPDPRRDCGD